MNPEKFAWRQPPYQYEHDKLPIDILAGSDVLRQQIEREVADRARSPTSWREDEQAFLRLRQRFLLY